MYFRKALVSCLHSLKIGDVDQDRSASARHEQTHSIVPRASPESMKRVKKKCFIPNFYEKKIDGEKKRKISSTIEFSSAQCIAGSYRGGKRYSGEQRPPPRDSSIIHIARIAGEKVKNREEMKNIAVQPSDVSYRNAAVTYAHRTGFFSRFGSFGAGQA